jgi:hypothetical protein
MSMRVLWRCGSSDSWWAWRRLAVFSHGLSADGKQRRGLVRGLGQGSESVKVLMMDTWMRAAVSLLKRVTPSAVLFMCVVCVCVREIVRSCVW